MFSSTVGRAAETIDEAAPLDPADLVPLSALCAEGFGYGSPYVQTPRDAIRVLADQLVGAVVADDLGRWCVTRDTARAMFAERADAERRQREAQDKHQARLAELAAENPPAEGIPIPEGMEDLDAVTVMRQHDIEAAAERKGARQRSTMDEMFTGALEYHPISDREEP